MQRNRPPVGLVKVIDATALAAAVSAADGVTHLRSISHGNEVPMSATRLALSLRSSVAGTSECETSGNDACTPANDTPAGTASSITATSPSTTGDQYTPNFSASERMSDALTGPNTAPLAAPKRTVMPDTTRDRLMATRTPAAPVDLISMRAARLPSATGCHASASSAMVWKAAGTARPMPMASG